MFGFFKIVAMRNALTLANKSTRKVDLELGIESALNEEQIYGISRTSLFKEIAGIYKKEGMSKWGGLSLFNRKFILIGLDKLKQNESIQPSLKELIDRLSFTATNIAASAHNLVLTWDDIRAVDLAFEAAEKWMSINSSTKVSEYLMNEVERSDCLAKTKTPTEKNDPEFRKMDFILELFLEIQEMLLRGGESKISFNNEKEKIKYIHFVFGAIDCLSRTIKDETRSELWAMTTSMGRAVILFGIDDALDHVESFGNTGDNSIEAATETGWTAMCIELNNKTSKEDKLKSSLLLYKTLREQ